MAFLDLFRRKDMQGQYVDIIQTGKAAYTPRDYVALAKEGFEKNVYVYRAVLAIAQAASGIPWNLFAQGRKLRQIDSHPLLDLLARPNPNEAQGEFFEKIVAFWLLNGNSYIHAIGPTTRAAPPRELWIMRPDRMKVVPASDTTVGGYEYWVDGKKHDLTAQEILQLKMFAASDDWYGLSPVSVAASLVDQMNEGNDWNTALLQNSGRPSGALIASGVLPNDQFQRLKKLVRQKYTGKRNAGFPLVLEGGLDWKQFALSPGELDWQKSKMNIGREIAVALGVPPEMVGDNQNKTYSNYQEARSSFYMETVLPLMDRLRDKLNTWLVPMFGPNLYLDYAKDEIEGMQEDQGVLSDRAVKQFNNMLITLNEARNTIGQDEIPGADVLYNIKTGELIPMSQFEQHVNLKLQASEAGMQTSILGAQTAQENQEQGQGGELPSPQPIKSLNLKRDEKRWFWKAQEARRGKYYDEAEKLTTDYFKSTYKDIVKAVGKAATAEGMASRAQVVIKRSKPDLKDTLKAIYLKVGSDFGKETYSNLKSARDHEHKDDSDLFDIWSEGAQDYIDSIADDKVSSITDTLMGHVKTVLSAGLSSGKGVDDIAGDLSEYFDTSAQAQTVAQTEVIAASNMGSRLGALQTGLDLQKEWIATSDGRTRESHADADGQTTDMDTPYDVGGSSLMFPGDSSLGADAGEVVNCRCTEAYKTVD